MKERLHPDRVATRAEQIAQDAAPLVLPRLARDVEVLLEVSSPCCHESPGHRLVQ